MYTGKTTAEINATKSIMHIILHFGFTKVGCLQLGIGPNGHIKISKLLNEGWEKIEQKFQNNQEFIYRHESKYSEYLPI